ncbi:MAG: gamma-glutamyltransferase [Desulfurococcaceae archaeon]
MIGKISIGHKGVVSDHQLAAQIGIEILKNGGNAFDAAIAVSAALSVVQPHMGGPGGDAFLLGFMGDEVIAYASSGRTPSGFDDEEYLKTKPLRGPLTVTVPGLVYLWSQIYEEYATMPLDSLLKPAIKLSYEGFYVGTSLAEACKLVEKELEQYKWSKYFKGLKLGEIYQNKKMTRTLRIIASRGFEEFYYGELAETLTRELQDQGVNIGLDDLMEHEGAKVIPLRLDADNLTLYELPPNTQGVSTLQLISAMYELELDKEQFDSQSRVLGWSKPTKDVYLFRDLYLGDPDYMNLDPQNYVKYSSLKSLPLEEQYVNIETNGDTTFFIVSDGETIIGFIQSLFHSFGSGLIAGGFPIQNRGVGFSKRKGLPNSPAPRKLPLHTLSILGVDAGETKYIIGCVGGDMRPQLHLRVFENIFVYKMRIDKAVAAPRFIYTKPYGKQELVIEKPLPQPINPGEDIYVNTVDYGEAKGHVHVGILKGKSSFLSCDPRSEGLPLSY